jgi:hypothetical protein
MSTAHRSPTSGIARVSVGGTFPIGRLLLLVAIALATIALPFVQLYATLSRFMTRQETMAFLVDRLASILGTPWAVIGVACSALVLVCLRPHKIIAFALALLASLYPIAMGLLGRDLVFVGPYSLLAVALWLYVAISTWRTAHANLRREG